jgi:hypothetical protein
MSHTRNWFFIALYLCAFCAFSGCASETNRWKEAASIGTIEAYEGFLSSFPDGEHSREASRKLEDAYLTRAKEIDTAGAYRDFLLRYPGNSAALDRAAWLEAQSSWREAQSSDTIEAYQRFLREHPRAEVWQRQAKRAITLLLLSSDRRLFVDIDVNGKADGDFTDECREVAHRLLHEKDITPAQTATGQEGRLTARVGVSSGGKIRIVYSNGSSPNQRTTEIVYSTVLELLSQAQDSPVLWSEEFRVIYEATIKDSRSIIAGFEVAFPNVPDEERIKGKKAFLSAFHAALEELIPSFVKSGQMQK